VHTCPHVAGHLYGRLGLLRRTSTPAVMYEPLSYRYQLPAVLPLSVRVYQERPTQFNRSAGFVKLTFNIYRHRKVTATQKSPRVVPTVLYADNLECTHGQRSTGGGRPAHKWIHE